VSAGSRCRDPTGDAISQLWRYPVKSMAGERLERAWLGRSGIPGDRVLYVVDGRGEILSARTKPRLLGHRATFGGDGEVLVDGMPWRSAEVAAAVRVAAGPDAKLVPAAGSERFDILPLLVATDGAIKAFGYDLRRLRPNIVISGVDGLAERRWQWSLLAAGDTVIALADLAAGASSRPGIRTPSPKTSMSCDASAGTLTA
jgi:uncharacterized protein